MNRCTATIWGLAVLFAIASPRAAAQELKVGITEQLGHLDVVHEGRSVRIQRIQDTNHRLADSWARTSRPCPPACIQPMVVAEGVATVGELELLDFLATKARSGGGWLVDARAPEAYRGETIPGAVNLPFSVVRPDNPHLDEVLQALGARRRGARWDFDAAKTLTLFCAGAWSDQAPRAAKVLLALGYPAGKMRYYRGGLQAWRSLGLTTVAANGTPR